MLVALERAWRTEIVLSAITGLELEHGLHPADRQARNAAARVPGYGFRCDPSRIVHQRPTRKTGITIPFVDLLVCTTALHFSNAVGTRNLRHFLLIYSSSDRKRVGQRVR